MRAVTAPQSSVFDMPAGRPIAGPDRPPGRPDAIIRAAFHVRDHAPLAALASRVVAPEQDRREERAQHGPDFPAGDES